MHVEVILTTASRGLSIVGSGTSWDLHLFLANPTDCFHRILLSGLEFVVRYLGGGGGVCARAARDSGVGDVLLSSGTGANCE